MGQVLKKPAELDGQPSFEREANRLLHSYSYLLKGVANKGKVEPMDTMKQQVLHQQWNIVFPLLRQSDEKTKYKYKFDEYVNTFNVYKYTGLDKVLEEPLLS